MLIKYRGSPRSLTSRKRGRTVLTPEAKKADPIPDYYDEENAGLIIKACRANSHIVQSPIMKPFQGSADLFKAQEEEKTVRMFTTDITIGWKDVVSGSVNITTVPGNHNTLVNEPDVKAPGEAVSKRLKGE